MRNATRPTARWRKASVPTAALRVLLLRRGAKRRPFFLASSGSTLPSRPESLSSSIQGKGTAWFIPFSEAPAPARRAPKLPRKRPEPSILNGEMERNRPNAESDQENAPIERSPKLLSAER